MNEPQREMTLQEKAENIIKLIDSKDINAEYLYNWQIDAMKEMCEKQIPYKPTSNVKFGIGKCKCGVEFLDKDTAYCGNCGQKLDWEES